MEFCDKIKKIRTDNNLTQEQFAEKLYVSRTAVSKWESRKGYPSIDSLKYMSKLFSISIDELLSSEEILDIAEQDKQQKLKKVTLKAPVPMKHQMSISLIRKALL